LGSLAFSVRLNRHEAWLACAFELLFLSICTADAQAAPSQGRPKAQIDLDACNSGADDFQVPLPGWQLTWENDSVIGPYGTDEFYTQGIQFGYRFKQSHQPELLARSTSAICRRLAHASRSDHQAFVGATSVFLGQHLFTPGNISDPRLIEDDRAYGAWLYLGSRLEVAQGFKNPGRLIKTGLFHTFELQLGITGHPAQGEWVQSNWHKLVVAPEPRGWRHELPTELGIQGRYAVRGLVADWRKASSGRQRTLQTQGTLDAGTNIGTLLVDGSVGTTWRVGRNLGDPITERLAGPAFVPLANQAGEQSQADPISTNLSRPIADAGEPCWRWARVQECYAYVGVTGHAIAFNAFLDGTLFHGGHTVDKESAVYDLTWGTSREVEPFSSRLRANQDEPRVLTSPEDCTVEEWPTRLRLPVHSLHCADRFEPEPSRPCLSRDLQCAAHCCCISKRQRFSTEITMKNSLAFRVISFLVASAVLPSGLCFGGNAFVTNYTPPQLPARAPDGTGEFAFVNGVKPSRWQRFKFQKDDKGAGDAELSPFGDAVEYKLNAVNYNLYFGDSKEVPFQLYYGDFASDSSPEDTNTKKLLDPTQGLAIQFPIAFKYIGDGRNSGRFCEFNEQKMPGSCTFGGDITLRGVRLNETNDAGDIKESFVFGGSAALKLSLQFPIFKVGSPSQAGALGVGLGVRYYYHNTDKQNLLFGKITDPNGSPIDAKKGFGALSAETEFDIFEHFKIRIEYFSPFNNRDVLKDVFKASIVLTPKK
jgi:hypothetical protein